MTSTPVRLTVFSITVGDPAFPYSRKSIEEQLYQDFYYEIIKDYRPMNVAFQEMINRVKTEYFIQVDEDMILNPDAVAIMLETMEAAPEDVGMICFHLWDDDRECRIQGIKIYRTKHMKNIIWKDVKASEVDILYQFSQMNVKWILHPDILGHHGVIYTLDTIYLRYKSMYEKDMAVFNTLTSDIIKKAQKYRETGDIKELFALFGAVHGIIDAPYCQNAEKDYQKYNLEALETLKRIFLEGSFTSKKYREQNEIHVQYYPPVDFREIEWKKPVKIHSIRQMVQIIRDHAEGREIYIWGAGDGGRKTMEVLAVAGINVAGFIDKNPLKIRQMMNNLPICSPDTVLSKSGSIPFVVIGSIYYEDIKKVLSEKGLEERKDFCVNYLLEYGLDFSRINF